MTYGNFDRCVIEIRGKKKDGTDEQELWLCASAIIEYIQNDHRPSLDLRPNKMDGGNGAKRSCDSAGRAAAAMATTRGGRRCFGQTSLRREEETADYEHNATRDSVTMDGRLVLNFVELTIG